MKLLSEPASLPYKCFSCGAGTSDRKYMDTEIDVEFYGVVYICEKCFAAWFNEWQSPTMKQMQATMNELASRVTELEDERDTLLGALNVVEYPTRTGMGQSTLDFESPVEAAKSKGSTDRKAESLSF